MSTVRPLPSISHDSAQRLLDRVGYVRVLVVGDVMLDRFILGHVTRISPEAPVPVVAADREVQRIGGAANVAHGVAALGARVDVIGIVGRDGEGEQLDCLCRDAGLGSVLVRDSERRTTMKVRIVTERNHQVARVDYEDDVEASGGVERELVREIARCAATADAIVVSDYAKGCVTACVMQEVTRSARARGIPVLVDPKVPHLNLYRGARFITPNQHEAEAATRRRVRTRLEARDAARVFRAMTGCAGVLLTCGESGVWLLDGETEGYLPTVAHEVTDVTGAGDTVIAVMAAALAAGGSAAQAAHLANQAAGVVVGRFGPATVTPADLLGAADTVDAGRALA